jgi:hypothetical protein
MMMGEIKKCIRCGECCIKNPCFLSKNILKDSNGKCSALENDNGKYSCGLYHKPTKYIDLGKPEHWKDAYFSETIKNLMGIGTICEKSSPVDLVRSIFGDISEEEAGCTLWNETAFPMVQASLLRNQLKELFIRVHKKSCEKGENVQEIEG